MGRSISVPDAGMASGATQVVKDLSREYKVFGHNGSVLQSEREEKDGSLVFEAEHKLEYAIGSGENGISFAIKRGDHLFQAPLSYYTATGQWGLSPGFAATGEGFNRPLLPACVSCHAGRAQPAAQGEGQYRDPALSELAIGCENCHGPGQVHAAAPSKASIVNPKRLPARLAEDICLKCHQAGEARVFLPGKTDADFRPGQSLVHTLAIFSTPAQQEEADLLEHHSSMKASRCFLATNGKLGCLTCHNPHEQPTPQQAPAAFNGKCLTCHNEKSCTAAPSVRMQTTPADNCISCHMPKRAVSQISHSALTNHRIPKSPQTALQAKAVQPQATPGLPGLVLVNGLSKSALLPVVTRLAAYGELMNRDPSLQPEYFRLLAEAQRSEPQNPLVLAALGRKALQSGNIPEALDFLRKAESKGSAASVTYIDLSEALTQAGLGAESASVLDKAQKLFPFSQPIRKRFILACIQQKNYANARTALDNYVHDFPEDEFMRGLLKQVSQK